ncbi:hypothetical protein EBT16_01720 [bacterium]|nr:hypothetical protein [bacterium]
MIDKYIHNWIMPDARGVLLVVASWSSRMMLEAAGSALATTLTIIVSLLAITDFSMKIYLKFKPQKKNKEKRKKGEHEEPDGH